MPTKSVTDFQDYPIHDDPEREWDGDDAVEQIREWASDDGSGDKDTIDWTKYRKGFLIYDSEDPERFGAYKFPYVYIVDASPEVPLQGIFAAASALEGGRAEPEPFDEGDIESAKNHLSRYYEKADEKFDDREIEDPFGDEEQSMSEEQSEEEPEDKGTHPDDDIETREVFEVNLGEPKMVDDRTIRATVSTNSRDRHGDIVRIDGLDISNFRKNPTILFAHNQKSFPIGKAVQLEKRDGELVADIRFNETEKGEEALQQVKEKTLNAFSIGFRPKGQETVEEIENEEGVTTGLEFKESELTEISLVPVGANAEALVHRKQIEAIAKSLDVEADLSLESISKEDEEDDGDEESEGQEITLENELTGPVKTLQPILASVAKLIESRKELNETVKSMQNRISDLEDQLDIQKNLAGILEYGDAKDLNEEDSQESEDFEVVFS